MFSIYPNPAKNELNFLIVNQQNKTIHYTITDVLGKIVEENNMTIIDQLYKSNLNTSKLINGCYFINFKSNSLNETQKFIIQK
jgi:hypothetical protein